MKVVIYALLVLCLILDAYCMKLSECPPGYRCQKKANHFRLVRAADDQDEYEPEPCPPGFYSAGEAIECTPCENGTYAPYHGLPSCTNCPIGHMCPQTDQEPQQCPIGSYADQKRQTCCRSCPDGKFAWLNGMSACYNCPAGHICKVAPRLACEGEDPRCAPFWKMPSSDQGIYFTYHNANTRIQGDSSRSVCASFRATHVNNNNIIFSFGSSDTTCDEGRGCNKHFSLGIRNGTHVDIYGMCYQHSNEAIRVSLNSIYDGKLHQICVTYNSTESQLCVYLDSQIPQCLTRQNPPYNTSLGDVRIGWWPDNTRRFVASKDGLIHSVSLYDRVIPETCIISR